MKCTTLIAWSSRLLLQLVLLAFSTAFSAAALAGKYTGPRFAEVIASIEKAERPPGERAHRPGWKLGATPATHVVVVARLRTVVSYWDNGWGFPKNVPSRIYASVPRAIAAARSTITVRLDYQALWSGHRPRGVNLVPRFLERSSYREDQLAEPLPRLLRLPELRQLARAEWDRSQRNFGELEEVVEQHRTRLERKRGAYRIEVPRMPSAYGPLKCKAGAHVVQHGDLQVVTWSKGKKTTLRIPLRAVHDAEFHGEPLPATPAKALRRLLSAQ